jgi:hypothetical protein
MKNLRNASVTALVLASIASLASMACDKGASGGATGSGSAASIAAPAPPDCDKVVEQIASLNPPDMRGDAEKKLWRSMCNDMKPEQRTCVVAAKTMDDMKKCVK